MEEQTAEGAPVMAVHCDSSASTGKVSSIVQPSPEIALDAAIPIKALPDPSTPIPDPSTPIWAWIIGCAAVFWMSTGIVFMIGMGPDTPAALKCAWRLGAMFVLQSPLAAYELWSGGPTLREHFLESLWLFFCLGGIIALNYTTFVFALATTTIPHACLIASTAPIVFVLWNTAFDGCLSLRDWQQRRSPPPTRLPDDGTFHPPPLKRSSSSIIKFWYGERRGPELPTALEVIGVVVGTAGTTWLFLSRDSDAAVAGAWAPSTPTLIGDVSALLCSVCFCLYVSLAGRLRKNFPIWCMCTASGFASLFCFAFVGVSGYVGTGPPLLLWGTAPTSVWGWANPSMFPVVLLSAILPGTLGHGLAVWALGYIPAFAFSIMNLAGPFLSIADSVAVGLQGAPAPIVWLAGPIILGGAALAVLGSRENAKRVRECRRRRQARVEIKG